MSYSLAAPSIGDIESSDWARRYARHKRPGRNVARHNRSSCDDSMVTYGNAGKDRCRPTDPDVVTKTNWRHPDWTRRLKGMVIRVEDGH